MATDNVQRGVDADTEWSDPGSTHGIPDRWQWRNLGGLYLTVGHNHRRAPDFMTFVVPVTQSPWKVFAFAPNDKALGQLDLRLVASGKAESLERARALAESAAQRWSPG